MNFGKIHKVSLAALGALLLGLLSLGLASQTASADVEKEDWLPLSQSRDNPCESGNYPISFAGTVHRVWYWTPEDTLIMRYNGHLTGAAADGTEYIYNLVRTMEHFNWPTTVTPYTDRIVGQRISKGSTVNALIVITYDTASPPAVTVTACVGAN